MIDVHTPSYFPANVDLEWIAAEGTSLRASRPLSGRSVDRLVQRLQVKIRIPYGMD